MNAYVDSSVLLRLLLHEPNRLKEFGGLGQAVTSEIAEVEVLRTLDRIRLTENRPDAGLMALRRRTFELLAVLEVVHLTGPVVRRAADPFPAVIRTLDALHLATAMVWRDHATMVDFRFATHDTAQAAVAAAVGFEVIGI